MAKSKQEKKNLIDSYVTWLNEAPTFFVIEPTKITPNDATELRKKLIASNASFNVVKNTLFKRALEQVKKSMAEGSVEGNNAIVFCRGEVSESAKVVFEFLKANEKGAIKGGLLDGASLSAQDVEQLAKLPSRDILLSMAVASFQAPIAGFVNVLNANIVNLVSVLKNISEKKN